MKQPCQNHKYQRENTQRLGGLGTSKVTHQWISFEKYQPGGPGLQFLVHKMRWCNQLGFAMALEVNKIQNLLERRGMRIHAHGGPSDRKIFDQIACSTRAEEPRYSEKYSTW